MTPPTESAVNAREEAIQLLLPRLKDRANGEEIGLLIDQALEQARTHHLESEALFETFKIHRACNDLAQAIEAYLAIQSPQFGTFLPLENSKRFLDEVKLLRERTVPTDWDQKKGKAGRNRQPVHVIALHLAAHSLLDMSETKPRNWVTDCTQLGAILCRLAGITLEKGESTSAAQKACDPEKLAKYGLLPYSPLPVIKLP